MRIRASPGRSLVISKAGFFFAKKTRGQKPKTQAQTKSRGQLSNIYCLTKDLALSLNLSNETVNLALVLFLQDAYYNHLLTSLTVTKVKDGISFHASSQCWSSADAKRRSILPSTKSSISYSDYLLQDSAQLFLEQNVNGVISYALLFPFIMKGNDIIPQE